MMFLGHERKPYCTITIFPLRNTDKCTNYYGNNSFNYDGWMRKERGKNRKGHMGEVAFFVFPILQQIFLCCTALYRQYYHFSSHTMFKSAFFPRIKPPTVNILI